MMRSRQDHGSAFGSARWPVVMVALTFMAILGWFWSRHEESGVVKLGLLHSLTGPMAISERAMVDAELLAIEQINAEGGVLGQKVEAVVRDGASDPETFVNMAETLVNLDQVSAIVGCWTSACRKAVRPVIERHDALFIYPMAYEGIEKSPNIIYTGAAPNQQVLPAINWSYEHLGKRFFLVGSDYVWPHSVNAIARDQIEALGGEVAGEAYIAYGSTNPADVIRKIREAKPDVILSTVVGDTNAPFYRQLREAGLTADHSPVVSFSIGENELPNLPASDIEGQYSAWGYFQSIDRAENREFIRAFRERYGARRTISDVVETSYFSVRLWALGVSRAGSIEPDEVNQAMGGLSFNAPEGIVTIDPATRHTWRTFNMGLIQGNGDIQVVWSTDHPIRPTPYPRSRSMKDWDGFLENLFLAWGHNWTNLHPGNPVKAAP